VEGKVLVNKLDTKFVHKRLYIYIFIFYIFYILRLHVCMLYSCIKVYNFPNFCINRKFPILNWAYPGSAWTTMDGEVRPQALDDANSETSLSLWGIFGSITCYILYAIVKDLRKEWPSIEQTTGEHSQATTVRVNVTEVEPHAEELPVSIPVGDGKEQNVQFSDAHPGYMQETPGDFDHVRDAALTSDATLDEFFSRPLRIASIDWAVNGTLYQSLNPWRLYFENSRVINRISNYKLMRAKLHLKFTINGNAFHYGRAIASYNPLPDDDTMTINRAFLDADLVAASQRPHVYLDPTNSQGGEMKLPFFTYYNVLDIVNEDWRNMGEVVLHSMQGLKHANGATDTVTVNVFAWAEDVKFAIPTNFEPGSILPQADEYEKKPVSRIAGAVANAAGYFTEIPTIGPFARATEIGAKAVGAIATLFGYSSPVDLEVSQFRPLAVSNISTTNQVNQSSKLSVDCKQELTLDSRTVGLDGTDELTIKYISQRESWITNFPWALNTSQETLLWNIVVDPCVHYKQGNEIHMPSTCFAATPFKYWRGTLKYRFQFVCSKYHKGRVKLVYDPTGTPSGGSAEYNTAYTTIVDISDNSDFEIEIGWGQRTSYRQHFQPGIYGQGSMWNTSPLAFSTPSDYVGNGTLSMYVVNELTVPNSTINNDIEVNVFISAGDDFEVAVPDAFPLEQLRFTRSGVTAAPNANEDVEPHAGESEVLADDSKPEGVTTLNTMASPVMRTDETNLIHFGESIYSFRQMLKRYQRHSTIASRDWSTGQLARAIVARKAFPHQVGYTSSPPTSVAYEITGATYVYGHTTLLNYVSSAYGGWRGGIRWMADLTMLEGASPVTAVVTRTDDGKPALDSWSVMSESTDQPIGQAQMVNNRTLCGRTYDGAVYQSSKVNPLVMWECPYYKNLRFAPAKRLDDISASDPFDTGWVLEAVSVTTGRSAEQYVPLLCAAAEDFNCFFYLGPPIFYYEGAAPSV
jgi:hypothetical protein